MSRSATKNGGHSFFSIIQFSGEKMAGGSPVGEEPRYLEHLRFYGH